MASSVYKAQIAIDLCEEHSNKERTLYCKTCQKNICSQCVKTSHIDHDWDALITVAKERKACLPDVCKNIRKNRLPRLETLEKSHVIDDKTDKVIQQLEKIQTSMIEATKKLINEKKQKYRTLKQSSQVSHSETEEMLKYMHMITESLDKNVHKYSDADVMEMEQQMMYTLEKLESLKREEENKTALFIPGHIDHKVLSDMIGEVISLDDQDQETLRSVDITETHTVQQFDARTIQPVGNDTAWIRDYEDNKVKLIDNKGNTIQTMRYGCIDFVVMDNGDHVYTGGKGVRVTSLDGSDRILCNTNPLRSTCISKTCDGDLLVSMRDGGDFYTITPSSRRLVQRMTMTGEVRTAYEFHEDGRSRFFTLPIRTAENRNGDVCAANRTSKDSGEVIIFHRDGRVRATYRGQSDSAEVFDPVDVDCDSRCRVIISDYNNRSVHLLSYDGTFLRYLLRELSGCPYSVSLYDDSLWLSLRSHSSKEVKVYRYK